jgi:hypothetical protein
MTPKNDFERDVIRFMSRIDEHMSNQTKRCNAHSDRLLAHETRMDKHETRTSSLETFSSVAKTISVGIPALVSVIWGLFEILKFIRG